MKNSDSIIIIPTYNEKENIENIIRAIFALEKYFHILIIEDNSPDGTADIVKRLQAEFPERLFMIERKGKFQLDKAIELGIEKQYWNRLQKGETIETQAGVLTPDMVLGEVRKGLKVTYCTDTRPTEGIVKNAVGADLFICEGMYGEPDKLEKAKEHKHMTFKEAAEMAKKAEVQELWLTHFSPSLPKAEPYMNDVRKIFPNAYAGKDGMSTELQFTEE